VITSYYIISEKKNIYIYIKNICSERRFRSSDPWVMGPVRFLCAISLRCYLRTSLVIFCDFCIWMYGKLSQSTR
jgi:hypothetical protein